MGPERVSDLGKLLKYQEKGVKKEEGFNMPPGYPLKVVYEEVEKDFKIITAYPLKKKHWG